MTLIYDIVKRDTESDSFFKDGIKKVHYVIVISRKAALNNEGLIHKFIRSLQMAGLEFEQSFGNTIPVIFIKIHLPKHVEDTISQSLPEWGVTKNHTSKFLDWKYLKPFGTPLQDRIPYVDGEEDSASKIYFICELLSAVKYGTEETERGIESLLVKGLITAMYPLHDGRLQYDDWDYDEDLNDRTLLAKYWADLYYFYKFQPIDMVKKYFGLDIAFYFAFMGFYSFSLVPNVIVALIVTFLSIANYFIYQNDEVEGLLCKDLGINLCGYCVEDKRTCYQFFLHHICKSLAISLILDNNITIIYPMFTALWSIMAMSWWEQREVELIQHWNLTDERIILTERFTFQFQTTYRHLVRSQLVIYRPWYKVVIKFMVTWIVVAVCALASIGCVILNVWLTNYLKIWYISLTYDPETGVAAETSFFFNVWLMANQVLMVRLCFEFYNSVTARLVQFQDHRYMEDHFKWFLYVRYMFAFLNHYISVFYMAFFKDLFYNIPFPSTYVPSFLTYISYEKCQPANCLDAVAITLMFFYIIILVQLVNDYRHSYNKKQQMMKIVLPQYEKEFKLNTSTKYKQQIDFTEIMIQHGFLTFFSAANLFSSMMILVISVLRMRLKAYKLMYILRRPPPRIRYNVQSWNRLISYSTLCGLLVNAQVMLFTTDYFTRMYFREDSIFLTYMRHLTVFEKKTRFNESSMTTCFFRDYRYDGGTKLEYNLNRDYYRVFIAKAIGLMAFESIFVVFIGIFKKYGKFFYIPMQKKKKLKRTKPAETQV